MKAAYKQKWLKALRSGKFNQKQGLLKIGNGFCCLGVLCEVTGTNFQLGQCQLKEEQLTKFGLKENTQQTLIKMNDIKRFTFKQIASYVSKNL